MEEDTYKTLAIILFFSLIVSFSNSRDLKKENERLQSNLEDYEYALNEANSNIENAKWYAWESYEDMGYALDNLETVEP